MTVAPPTIHFTDLEVGVGAPDGDVRALIELRRAAADAWAGPTTGLLQYMYSDRKTDALTPGVDHVDLLGVLPFSRFRSSRVVLDAAVALLGEGHNMLVLRVALAEERVAQLTTLLHEYREFNTTLRDRLEALERDVTQMERGTQP